MMLTGGHFPSRSEAFRTVVATSAPFRAGTRFFVFPDVRFFVEGAQIRLPGTLLPDSSDATVEKYFCRMMQRPGAGSFMLSVEQPLMSDFRLWAKTRALAIELFERIGWPVLPVTSELALGHFSRALSGNQRKDHSLFALVLSGTLTAVLDGTRVERRAGEVLYVASPSSLREERWEECMVLRLWIPTHERSALLAMKDLACELLQEVFSESAAVPYAPFPPRQHRDGSSAPLEPLLTTARGLDELAKGSRFTDALRVAWAKRVSAAALEPAPPPKRHRPLEASDEVRPAPHGSIVRISRGPGQSICAVNGHAFSVSDHPVATRMVEALASGERRRGGDLLALARRNAERRFALALLERIHDLRGVNRVNRARRPLE